MSEYKIFDFESSIHFLKIMHDINKQEVKIKRKKIYMMRKNMKLRIYIYIYIYTGCTRKIGTSEYF